MSVDTRVTEKTLVIGGAGYIGSVLTPYLDADSWDLELFGNPGKVPNQRFNLRYVTEELLAPYRNIVLLAGHSSVPMAKGSRLANVLYNNVQNFVRLVELLHPSQRLVYASSSGVYGGSGSSALRTENDNLGFSPTNVYDLSKWEIDQYAQLSGKDVYGLRFGTVNGWSPNFRADVMLNQMFLTAKEKGMIHACNPHIWRPILFLQDLCQAVKAILTSSVRAPGIYNLASCNATVAELARTAGSIAHTEVLWGPATPSYDMRISSERLTSTFGWRPVFDEPFSPAHTLWSDLQNKVCQCSRRDQGVDNV
jgi:nucleoside-diphosphate-sugar epimerase